MIQNGLVRRLFGALAMIVGILLLVSLLRLGLAVYLYAEIARWATSRLGVDYYAAELMGVAFSALIMCFVPGLGSLIVSRRKRLASASLVVGGYLVVCLLVYTVGRETYFNQSTGEPLRYYAETPDGIVFSFLPGYDPKWGIERKPYTRETAQELLRRRQALDEQKRKAQLDSQKRLESERRAQEARLLKEQETERRRAEAEAQRRYELEQARLSAEAERERREFEQQQEEARRRHEMEQKQLENQRYLEEQRFAAEIESERRAEEQRREAEERERQRQASAEEQRRRDEEERRKEESARERQERIYRVIDLGKREIERRTGKRLPRVIQR
jgi:hypothetical protein